MGLLARQLGWGLSPFDLRQLVHAAVPVMQGRGVAARRRCAADTLTVRALASVGLAGLFALPFLMLASVVMQAPFAIPATISLGYLAAARALVSGDARRAAAWRIAVLCGFVAWTALFLLSGDAELSRAGLAAVLLAPLFSAAPAVARILLAGKPDPALAAAMQAAACLDRLAPSECAFFLDKAGALLSATRAALASLGLPSEVAVPDISREFDLADRPVLLVALASCRGESSPIEINLKLVAASGAQERRFAAALVAGPHQSVTMRLCELASGDPERHGTEGADGDDTTCAAEVVAASETHGSRSDVGEAIDFALRHVRQKAEERGIALTAGSEAAIVAACDRPTIRRILVMLTESALGVCGPEGTIGVWARALKGIVLLRVSVSSGCAREAATDALREALRRTSIAETVDAAGGSVIVEASAEGASASVRLALAGAQMAERR